MLIEFLKDLKLISRHFNINTSVISFVRVEGMVKLQYLLVKILRLHLNFGKVDLHLSLMLLYVSPALIGIVLTLRASNWLTLQLLRAWRIWDSTWAIRCLSLQP